MLFNILWLTNLLTISSSFSLNENLNVIERHTDSATPTTKMISRLIEESNRSTVLFIHLNSDILDNFAKFHNVQATIEVNNMKLASELRDRELDDKMFHLESYQQILDNFTRIDNKTMEINNTKVASKFSKRKYDATVFHLQSYEEFENFFPLIRREYFLYGGHFIIVYGSADEQEIEKMFYKFWNAYIYNVNVLVMNEKVTSGSVSMFTYMPFTNESCGDTKPIRINVFNKTTMNWATSDFYPEKFNQLNRCPLRFVSYDNRARFIINENESGIKRYSGIEVDIVVMFSNALNSTLNISDNDPLKETAFQKILKNKIDFVFGVLLNDRVEILDASQMVYTDALVLVVPPPFLIAPIKKIFLPFTVASWTSIGLVTFSSFCVVTILKFTPTILHDYVIGSNVKGSILSVWNIFLGGSQTVLPRSNFPRYLLAIFLIFTLIIRTVYQGKVFDLMKRDVWTVELKTVDAFIEHEFTFYIYEYIIARFQGSRVLQRFQVIRDTDRMLYNIMTMDSSFKGVVLNYLDSVLFEAKKNNMSFWICRESMYTSAYVFYFPKNYYLIDKFDEVMGRLKSAGLLDFIHSKYIDKNLMMRTSQGNTPLPLNYGHIEGFFTVFCGGCALALIGFICEITCFTLLRQKLSPLID